MSQVKRLHEWLEEYGHIEPMEALNHLGIYRLAARISDLRKSGIEILTHTVTVKNQFGEECRVARYELVSRAA